MLTPERHRAILRLLSQRGQVMLSEIETRFSVSPATARRDAESVSEAGLAQRTRGGLLPLDFALAEPVYVAKTAKAANAKARIGQAAADLVPENGSVFVDAGTTCLEVGRVLLDRPGLQIFTNSIPLLGLADDARASLCAIGGQVRKVSQALTGSLALHWLEQLRFDVAIVGASGLETCSGAFTTEAAEAGVKSEALRRAHLRILVAHAEKWSKPAALRFAVWRTFHHVVTDKILSREERTKLAQAGVKLVTLKSK